MTSRDRWKRGAATLAASLILTIVPACRASAGLRPSRSRCPARTEAARPRLYSVLRPIFEAPGAPPLVPSGYAGATYGPRVRGAYIPTTFNPGPFHRRSDP